MRYLLLILIISMSYVAYGEPLPKLNYLSGYIEADELTKLIDDFARTDKTVPFQLKKDYVALEIDRYYRDKIMGRPCEMEFTYLEFQDSIIGRLSILGSLFIVSEGHTALKINTLNDLVDYIDEATAYAVDPDRHTGLRESLSYFYITKERKVDEKKVFFKSFEAGVVQYIFYDQNYGRGNDEFDEYLGGRVILHF